MLAERIGGAKTDRMRDEGGLVLPSSSAAIAGELSKDRSFRCLCTHAYAGLLAKCSRSVDVGW